MQWTKEGVSPLLINPTGDLKASRTGLLGPNVCLERHFICLPVFVQSMQCLCVFVGIMPPGSILPLPPPAGNVFVYPISFFYSDYVANILHTTRFLSSYRSFYTFDT